MVSWNWKCTHNPLHFFPQDIRNPGQFTNQASKYLVIFHSHFPMMLWLLNWKLWHALAKWTIHSQCRIEYLNESSNVSNNNLEIARNYPSVKLQWVHSFCLKLLRFRTTLLFLVSPYLFSFPELLMITHEVGPFDTPLKMQRLASPWAQHWSIRKWDNVWFVWLEKVNKDIPILPVVKSHSRTLWLTYYKK